MIQIERSTSERFTHTRIYKKKGTFKNICIFVSCYFSSPCIYIFLFLTLCFIFSYFYFQFFSVHSVSCNNFYKNHLTCVFLWYFLHFCIIIVSVIYFVSFNVYFQPFLICFVFNNSCTIFIFFVFSKHFSNVFFKRHATKYISYVFTYPSY